MKKTLGIILAVVLMLGLMPAGVCADGGRIPLIIINGTALNTDVAPIITDGRTLVPVRAISENFGYDVQWAGEEAKVTVTNNGDTLELYVGKTEYTKNGEGKTMDVPPVIVNDRTLVPLRLIAEEMGCDVAWDGESYKVSITKFNEVRVTDAVKFVNAIASYTNIILADGEYNLTKVGVEDIINNPNTYVESVFDGSEIIVKNVTNLKITAEEGAAPSLVVEPRYADVLSFVDCGNIEISNITAGHTPEQGNCAGAVLNFENCKNTDISNCNLFGCGTYGIVADNCVGMNVADTEIYECTYGALVLSQCGGVAFNSCTIRDCEGFGMINISNSFGVEFKKCVIQNNVVIGENALINSANSVGVNFTSCEIKGNTYEKRVNGSGVNFVACKIEE